MTLSRRFVLLAAVLSFIVGSSGAFVWQALAQDPGQAQLPAPPRTFLDTTYTAPSGRTIAVGAGGDLQTALNAAQPGDVIALQPSAIFRGNFNLPNKSGSAWITIRSAAFDDTLPAPGTRITPSFFPAMPKILSPNQSPAVYTQPGAHHYRFIGVEFAAAPDVKMIYSIVAFGGDEKADADKPHHLILDRCYVHGNAGLNSRRGVLLNGASSAIVESHISEIHEVGRDSQAVLGYNGPGPFKIVNNFLEGATENIMFGGGDPTIRGLVPSDIEIRRNHLFKPLSWRPGDPGFAGVPWLVKNLLELKNAQRVLIEGNFLENNWGGNALVLTPRNQEGTAPWSVVQDVLFRSNIVKNSLGGFALQTSDDLQPSQPTERIAIVNNAWGVTRTFFGLTGVSGRVGEDLLVDHNTAIPCGYSGFYMEFPNPPAMIRFRLTNNLIGFGSFGVAFPKGDPRWLPGATIARNALVNVADIGDGQGPTRNANHDQAMYTPFPNAAAAGLNADGTLTAKSPNRRAGTDGKDIGADFDELLRAYTGQSSRK